MVLSNTRKKTWSLLFHGCAVALLMNLGSCNSSADKKDKESGETSAKEEIPLREAFALQKGKLTSNLKIPGELIAFQEVDLYAKVNSFVKKLYVDVGSEVRTGELLAVLEAPEIQSQLSAAESRLKSQEAIYISSKATYDRLLQTSKTPGTIAQNDLDMAQAKANSDNALLESAKANYKEISETEKYLEIRAPFDGVISMRNVNTGAYVGPSGKGSELPIFKLQEQRKLRLVISVPENFTAFLKLKGQVGFTVSSRPSQTFTATLARLAGAVGNQLRSERVEMDVYNPDKKLLPGMAAEVTIPLPSEDSVFLVPNTACVNSTIQPFVIRATAGKAEWVHVKIGRTAEGMTEVYGKLNPGDTLLKTAGEEIRDGSPLKINLGKSGSK